MYTNIVVPFDKSEHAERALKAAVELGRGDGPAKVTVLNVTDMMDFDDATFEVAARMAGVGNLRCVSQVCNRSDLRHIASSFLAHNYSIIMCKIQGVLGRS